MEKEINFNGATLLALQINGTYYISMRHVCTGIGLNENQRKYIINKLNKDGTLKGGRKLYPLKTKGGIQKVLMIELDYLPLWLAKINPSRFSDELKAKLLDYQLHAKDVLADAFLGKRSSQEEESREYSPHLNEILDRARTLTELETQKRELLKRITEINRLLYFNYHMINWRASDRKGIIENEDKYIEHSFKTNFTMNDSELTTLEIDELNMGKDEE